MIIPRRVDVLRGSRPDRHADDAAEEERHERSERS
jgi:hypothetical protein